MAAATEEEAVSLDFLAEQARNELCAFVDERIEEHLAALPVGSPWLSIAEGAEYLRLSPSMLRKLIARKKIEAHGVGRRRLVHRDELDRFVRGGGGGTTPVAPMTRRRAVP